MKALIQRVLKAKVTVKYGKKEEISRGIVVFVGITNEDTREGAWWLAEKILNLRIFPNEEGKFDRSVVDIKGEIMAVSQFTLYGDCSRGRRPDFLKASKPEHSKPLYEEFVAKLAVSGLKVVTGEFGADMLVEIHNDGPVTLIVDSAKSPGKIC